MNAAQLRETIAAAYPHDQDILISALAVAERAHAGQTRKSGEPYIHHPYAVAQRLIAWGMDVETVAAGILHDVPEDTDITIDELTAQFGQTIGFLVSGVTKVGYLKYRGIDRYADNLRRMFIAMAEDIRVVIIKFADRLHNLETLKALPPAKRVRIARESMEIFAPLAHRLGMGDIRGQLEDLAFPYVLPKEHAWLTAMVGSQYPHLESIVNDMIWSLRQHLTGADLAPLDIHGRRKHLYSLYRKVIRPEYDRDLRRITDLVALRVIMPNPTGCYAALGIVHQHWKPMPGRFKDYIAQPKPNGYRSIHTTVFGPGGVPIEIQIRDQEMHQFAEYGAAAHWHYSESDKPNSGTVVTRRYDWVRELSDARQGQNAEQYLESLRIDALQRRIFCFTPNGDVIDLPEGATVVDFAYNVHSDLGDQCTGARVNDKMSSVDTELHSGDVVDIVVNKQRKRPNPDWIKFVKTEQARSHIRRASRQRDTTNQAS